MYRSSIRELRLALDTKKISSTELTKLFLDRIEKKDKELNALITVCKEQALIQAKKADEKIQKGEVSALTGIPMIQKDIFCTKGTKTTAGSKILNPFIAPYNATSVEKFNAAGAVMLGKANMDEFAMGSSGENSAYGTSKNPWDLKRTPGGSSSGSAASVAARFVPIATGTDTGGSIRQPAAFSGITGLKPTYGLVSRYGMIAFASSLDQGGLLSISAEDIALALPTMAGHDPKDSTSANVPVPDYSLDLKKPIKNLKIGLPKEYFSTKLSAAMQACIQNAVDELKKLGAQFVEISLPHTELALPAYYIIAPAECSSNLARFDGVRYGYRCENPKDLEDLYVRTRTEGFGEEVKRRILIGTYVLSAGYYDAFYMQALKVRRLIKQDFVEAFKNVDCILSPTTPTTAFELNSITDPVTMYLNDIYTIATSLAGLPALSMPCGFIEGLPAGVQLIGNYFKEAQLLNIAHQYQTATHWHTELPAWSKS